MHNYDYSVTVMSPCTGPDDSHLSVAMSMAIQSGSYSGTWKFSHYAKLNVRVSYSTYCNLHVILLKTLQSSKLLSVLEKMQHAMLEEVEGDTCLPHRGEEARG